MLPEAGFVGVSREAISEGLSVTWGTNHAWRAGK